VSGSGGTAIVCVVPENGSVSSMSTARRAERDRVDRDVERLGLARDVERARVAGRVLAVGEQHDHAGSRRVPLPSRFADRASAPPRCRAAAQSPIAVPPSATSGRARR
jgi:hypothetical protein